MHIIDPKKILLVVNSSTATNIYGQNMAQSVVDADDYVIKRGLTTEYRVAFDFGTQYGFDETQLKNLKCVSNPFVGMNFIDTISRAIEIWKIEGIIFSTYTPSAFYNSGYDVPLSIFAAAATNIKKLSNTNSYEYSFNNTNSPLIGSSYKNSYAQIIFQSVQDWVPYVQGQVNNVNPYNPNQMIAHGRLGCPYTGLDYPRTIAEHTIYGTGASVYASSVTKALAAETQNNLDKSHIITNTISYNISSAHNQISYNWANAIRSTSSYGAGFTNKYSVTTYPAVDRPFWVRPSGIGVGYNPAIDPAISNIFCMCMNVAWNSDTDVPSQYAGRIANGAWGYTWTSYAFNWANSILRNGGSCAISTVSEPLSDGLPLPEQILVNTGYWGMPIMQAALLSQGNDGTARRFFVCGDPLYAPYKATPPLNPPAAIPFPPIPAQPGWIIDSGHDGVLPDKREKYEKINKEIENKNKELFEKELTEKERKKKQLVETQARYELYLQLREKYLKSRQ